MGWLVCDLHRHGFAHARDRVIILAGIPFGTIGSTNVLHVSRLTGKELEGRAD